MDLRTEKTKKAILNAFITLRAEKPLEKITIKELAGLACINKATFYRHYEDIYALSESMTALWIFFLCSTRNMQMIWKRKY